MGAPIYLRKVARALGVYRPARYLYRRLKLDVRRHRMADLKLYGQFIGRGDLVFDIGCNLGQKAEIFLGLGARVVALEPNPNCITFLRRDFGTDERFTLLQQAVGSKPGVGALTFANTISTASMKQDWHGLEYRDGGLEQVTVSITTLDKLIEDYGIPRFCKIDVEGFELEVIRGLNSLISIVTLGYHVNDSASILACLEQMSTLGRIEINAIAMNEGDLAIPHWLDLDGFRQWLLRNDVPAAGDVFVRSMPLQTRDDR